LACLLAERNAKEKVLAAAQQIRQTFRSADPLNPKTLGEFWIGTPLQADQSHPEWT
jgi:hypothetical protein